MKTSVMPFGHYKWTDNKIDLVKIIDAIYTAASINKGNVELSEIAKLFGQIFDKDLSNIYRIYSEVKHKKFDKIFRFPKRRTT